MTDEEHPSYAAISVHRVSGRRHLFMSEAVHQHFVRLAISPAVVKRNLATDWMFGLNRPFIEIDMSEAQWTHFMSSANLGNGTPCTLARLNGEAVEEPPPPRAKTEKFSADVREHLSKVLDDIKEIEALVASSTMGKNTSKTLTHMLDVLRSHLLTSMPFIADQFSEDMEDTMLKARQEIEAYFVQRGLEIGLSSGAQQPLALSTNKGDGDGAS
jgi:hypothetical protein